MPLTISVRASRCDYHHFQKASSDGAHESSSSDNNDSAAKEPPPETEWKDRSLAYKITYITCAVVLVVMHLEWFSGGFLSVRLAKQFGIFPAVADMHNNATTDSSGPTPHPQL